MNVDRLVYTGAGLAGYTLDSLGSTIRSSSNATKPSSKTQEPHILFTFWDAPKYDQAVKLFKELQQRFSGDSLPIGVSLFTRPMGDVIEEENYAYDPRKLNTFFDAAATADMPVFIITSGTEWTEVAYRRSSLIRMLIAQEGNLMKYEDGTTVQRKLQPPGDILHGMFGSDANGVAYFSHQSPTVTHYRVRNLSQMAGCIGFFAQQHPDLYLGVSTENEIDYPGSWITGGRVTDYSEYSVKAAQRERISPGFSVKYQSFRESSVRQVLAENVRVFKEAGLSNIYTCQSVEDAENRASPLSSADIEGSNVGITAWRTDNENLFVQTSALARERGKKWALVVTNPLTLNLAANQKELRSAIGHGATMVGVYNWWPHFWGYGVRGMPVEKAIMALTR